ncbi:hypothetical protein LIA77_06874 [Sarocladium implicatum]|nr:hypothetical protein LIA77_06874 [Sarocladium implicatum]
MVVVVVVVVMMLHRPGQCCVDEEKAGGSGCPLERITVLDLAVEGRNAVAAVRAGRGQANTGSFLFSPHPRWQPRGAACTVVRHGHHVSEKYVARERSMEQWAWCRT